MWFLPFGAVAAPTIVGLTNGGALGKDVCSISVISKPASAKVPVDEAEDADLLVVGSRGHGEAVGVLLGSVSEYCRDARRLRSRRGPP